VRAVRTRRMGRSMRRLVSPTRAIAGAGLLAILAVVAAFGTARPEAQSTLQTINCSTGFGEVPEAALAFIRVKSLKTVPNPVFPPIDPATGEFTDAMPPGVAQDLKDVAGLRVAEELAPYIRNVQAAIRLGKAFFWDMQAGSDNQTACATCHFQAGADGRGRAQMSPGYNGSFDGFAVDQGLTGSDFPLLSSVTREARSDNVIGSQGVRKMAYGGLGSNGSEITTPIADPVFHVGSGNIRQVGGVQAPSVLNAVFNHRNFWDGRAQPDFNGVNVWGARDATAHVWTLDVRGTPVQTTIRIPNASLASQAVGPPLNPLEMTAEGRTFPELGKKLLGRKPLALQAVDPTDSVLGEVADATAGTGLNTTYSALVQAAFAPGWWNSKKTVSIGGKSYSMMQANFPLFWGLSIMLYEATLVSDESPMDRYLASRVVDPITGEVLSDSPSLLQEVADRLNAESLDPDHQITPQDIVAGLELFELPLSPETIRGNGIPAGSGAGCTGCHVGAELTSASVQNLTGHAPEPGDLVLQNAGFDLRMERMFRQLPPVPDGSERVTFDPYLYEVNVTRISGAAVGPIPAPSAVYDAGWYNVGVRRNVENVALGGKDPWGRFLSWTQSLQASEDPSRFSIPGGGLGCAQSPPAAPSTSPFAGEVLNPLTGLPLLAGPLRSTERVAIDGSVKTPSLRNVELTGPYFHNGGKATLAQVLEFYDVGGDVDNPTRAPLIMPLLFEPEQQRNLIAFLAALTDEHVRYRKAPFDHPEIRLPNGVDANGDDVFEVLGAVGADGGEPLRRFLGLSLTDGGTDPGPLPPAPKPLAAADSFALDEDTQGDVSVLANDTMDDGSGIPAEATVQLVVLPMNGTASVNANRTLRYVPRPDFNGPDSLQYRVTVNGEPSTATVSITVRPVDEPPAPAETIAITQASYQVRRDQWAVSGTSTGVNAGTTLEIRYLPPGATDGSVIARVTVSTTGSWSFSSRGSGIRAASGSQVKVTSPAGTTAIRSVTIN